MSSWTTPKTNWESTDFFNISDFNRIKNNIEYIHENSQNFCGEYSIEDMGQDITSYAERWNFTYFNAFEKNIETINSKMINEDIGIKKTFYPNGVFITASELNRIESAIKSFKNIVDGWYEGLSVLPFRLGNGDINE